MTITERNKQLQDLRIELAWLRVKMSAVEDSIRFVNQKYKDELMFQTEDLMTQMF
jgi:hypothetical protein